jgi:hypothetical protein
MRRRGKRWVIALAAIDAAALALAGCSGGGLPGAGLGGGGGPLPYQYSNAMMPQGYSESVIGPDRYRIEVRGPVNTPRERLEKIATTRAAEIGKDNRLGFFKIDGVQQTNHCQKYTAGGGRGGNGAEQKRSAYTVFTADVSYTRTPPDTSYIEAKPAFEQYRAALDSDGPPPPLDPALVAQCG